MIPIATPRREHVGGSAPTTLAQTMTAADTQLQGADLSSFPTGNVGQFVITVGRQSQAEERMLVASRNGNVLNLLSRGWDGTAATTHAPGESVEHTDSATEFDEANVHITSSVAHGIEGAFVDTVSEQEVFNKTISGSSNELSNIPMDAVTGLTELLPIGAVTMAAVSDPAATAWNKWLLCDGATVLRADYPELFAVIGITFGAGDGATNFLLPDLRGLLPMGADASHALGSKGGSTTHTLATANLPAHSHTNGNAGSHTHTTGASGAAQEDISANFTLVDGTSLAATAQPIRAGAASGRLSKNIESLVGTNHTHTVSTAADHTHTSASVGSGTAVDHTSPYLALHYLIKAVP